MAYKGGLIGNDNLYVPDAPTIGDATAGDAQVSVTFTAPSDVGNDAITAYGVSATDGTNVIGATGSSSPVTVTGLSNGTSYTAQAWAINDYGNGPLSAATSSFTPAAPRGIYGGGYDGSPNYTNVIQYITITSTGNATDFGDLTVARIFGAGAASSTRGVFNGGHNDSVSGTIIDYITISSTGNATDFGDPANARQGGLGAFNNDTRAVIAGGHNSATNALEYITIASTGNGTNFGNLSGQLTQNTAFSSTTRGIIAAGRHGGNRVDVIEYVTTASTGNATDFGNLSTAKDQCALSSSNSTIGVIAGGESGSSARVDDIEQITIASTGNATDFGNLLAAGKEGAGGNCSNSTRGILWGNNTGSRSNVIEYVTFGSASNSTDFGDLLAASDRGYSLSNTNGGLS
jgi:hypothetical protein